MTARKPLERPAFPYEESRHKIAERMAGLTREGAHEVLVDAGIVSDDGRLTVQYGGDAEPAKRGRGRPPLPEGERRDQTHRIPLYPSAAERAELDAWAEREGAPLGRIILDRALRSARRG